jgi:hypothetical protein
MVLVGQTIAFCRLSFSEAEGRLSNRRQDAILPYNRTIQNPLRRSRTVLRRCGRGILACVGFSAIISQLEPLPKKPEATLRQLPVCRSNRRRVDQTAFLRWFTDSMETVLRLRLV